MIDLQKLIEESIIAESDQYEPEDLDIVHFNDIVEKINQYPRSFMLTVTDETGERIPAKASQFDPTYAGEYGILFQDPRGKQGLLKLFFNRAGILQFAKAVGSTTANPMLQFVLDHFGLHYMGEEF